MKRILLAALVGTAPVVALHSQTSGEVIIDRVQQTTPPPAPASGTPAPTSGEQGDLDGGVQRIAQERKLPFRLILAYDIQAYYSSNVFLSEADEVDAVILANTLQARAEFNSFTLGQSLVTPSAGLVYQRYNHDFFSDDPARETLDFDAYSLPLGLRFRFGDNWEVNLGVTGTVVYSLEGPPSYNLTYQSITTSLSARKLIYIGNNQLFTFGGGFSFAKTDADVPAAPFGYRSDRNDKIDTSLDIGYYYVKDRWVFGSYARVVHSEFDHYQEAGFTDVDRRDITFSLGVSTTYNINKWAVARAFTGTDWRAPQADNPGKIYTYQNTNLGLGLSLTTSF